MNKHLVEISRLARVSARGNWAAFHADTPPAFVPDGADGPAVQAFIRTQIRKANGSVLDFTHWNEADHLEFVAHVSAVMGPDGAHRTLSAWGDFLTNLAIHRLDGYIDRLRGQLATIRSNREMELAPKVTREMREAARMRNKALEDAHAERDQAERDHSETHGFLGGAMALVSPWFAARRDHAETHLAEAVLAEKDAEREVAEKKFRDSGTDRGFLKRLAEEEKPLLVRESVLAEVEAAIRMGDQSTVLRMVQGDFDGAARMATAALGRPDVVYESDVDLAQQGRFRALEASLQQSMLRFEARLSGQIGRSARTSQGMRIGIFG